MTIDMEAAREIINEGKGKGLITEGVPNVVRTVKKPKGEAESPHPAMQFKCPTCGATEGALCKPVFGGWVGQERVHYSRMTLFENQTA
jgi:hypothetical protein